MRVTATAYWSSKHRGFVFAYDGLLWKGPPVNSTLIKEGSVYEFETNDAKRIE